jgi:CheY-like chemotaxis protein
MEILLNDLGVDVQIAEDGVEAETLFQKEKFNLVLMDINMPNKNGIEAMRSIKKYEQSQGTRTPIVALTANATNGDEEKYLIQGFDAYISKPVDNEKLINTLSQLCTETDS